MNEFNEENLKVEVENLFEIKEFLEDLLGKYYSICGEPIIKDKNTLEILADKEVIETIKKYKDIDAAKIAYYLGSTALLLKNKYAIIEMSRTIGKHNGDVAKEIANHLYILAYYLEDKDVFIELSKTIRKYDNFAAERIACWLKEIAESKNKALVIEMSEMLALDEIVNTVKKYDSYAAKAIALSLAETIYSLKDDRNAIIKISEILALDEVVNTVKKYNEDIYISWDIAYFLGQIAYHLREENAVIEVIRTIGKYNGQVANNITCCLYRITYELKDRNAVVETSRTIRKYDGAVACEVAIWLSVAAEKLKDKNAVIEISEIFSSDEVVNTIKKYRGDTAQWIVYWLAYTVFEFKNKDAIIEISRTIRKYDDSGVAELIFSLYNVARYSEDKDIITKACETIRKYDSPIAEIIASWLACNDPFFKYYKDNVIRVSKIFSSDEVINIVKKYDKNVVRGITDSLCRIAYYLRNEDTIIEVIKTVGKYGGDIAKEIARYLGETADRLKYEESGDAIIEMIKTIRKYEGEAAKEIAYQLGRAAQDLKDSSKVIRLIKMLEKVGKSMSDILFENEIHEIINLGLDNLIKDRKSFDAIAIYIKSKKELPLPTENNIDNYLSLALDYVKSKYGLIKDINLDQMLMFFTIDEYKRKEVIGFINKSKEINPKYYSLFIKSKNDFLNYSRNDLEKYAIISIIGSRNKELEKGARNIISAIVGEKVINKARNEFYNNYKYLIKEIANAFNQGNYEKAINILKQTNNEAILDVINSVNYRDVNINSNIVKAVESKNPLDYDNRIQMACVYLPNGNGILEYCIDDRIKLIRYDIGNETLGSAICYLEDKKLLVDSIEGHRRFRKEEIFEIVYNDLIERAKEWKAEIVIFNKNAPNKTPREFIEYLKSKNLKEDKIEMKLDTEAYLEANEKVKRYVVKIS
ncbi:MAG: hypothetical protein QXJ14_03430 [Candidatus Aenigmatarchaeota archaeon]